MNIFDWLTGCFSSHGKAMSLYKRGMAKAKKHDRLGALEDYTGVVYSDAEKEEGKKLLRDFPKY